jgi:hypothetical protein
VLAVFPPFTKGGRRGDFGKGGNGDDALKTA